MGETKKLNVSEKLMLVQEKLRAPKTEYNSFGKYKYRNTESILKAVKPLLSEVKALITLEDDVIFLEGRYYVKTTASFVDVESGEKISTSASAREEENKKGMDGSQITGAAGSYSRKYALNGLLLIDDNKDADATNNGEPKKPTPTKPKSSKARDEVLKYIKENSLVMADIAKEFGLSKDTIDEVYTSTLEALKARA